MIVPLMGKDPRWLQVEVCREFQRGKCSRTEDECRFAHPPAHVAIHNGRVTACFDSLKERCQREKCKYLHPPKHLKTQLETNGRMLQHQQQQMAMQQQLMQQQMLASNSALLPTWPVTVPTSNGTLIQQPVAFLSDPAGVPGTPRRLDKSDKLEVCREYQRGACSRDESECRYAHPPRHTSIDTSDGMVTVCMDFIKGKCQRETCKYFHPPTHLQGKVKAAQQQQMSLPMSPGEPLRKQAATMEVPILMSSFTAPQFPQGLAAMQFPGLPSVPLVAGLQMFPQQTQWTPQVPQSGNFIPMDMATPPPTPQNMSPPQPQTTFVQAPAPAQPQFETYEPYQYQMISPAQGQPVTDMQYSNGYYYSVMPGTYGSPNGF